MATTLLLLPLLALGPGPLPALQEEEPLPAVSLELEAPDGSLRTIRAGEPVLTDPRAEQAWIVRVRGERPGATAAPADPGLGAVEVALVGGDLLRGAIIDGKDESLTVRIAGGALLPLTIEGIERLVLPDNLPASLAAPLAAPEEGDRIYLRTGNTLDRDDGTVIAFSETGLQFESLVLGVREVEWGQLAALFVEVFGDSEPGDEAGTGVPVSVDLVDGGRLRGRFQRLDAARLDLVVGRGTEVRLPLSRVARVTVEDGRLAYLSSLTPVEEVGRGAPFGDELGLVFDHAMDRSVVGGPLTVGNQRFARGIGMHAPSRLRFDLPAGWTRLRGKVGIDGSTARLPEEARGSVVFRVRFGGELLWESRVVRGGDAALALPNLTLPAGSDDRSLELEVDVVEDFRGDRANWLELLLVRD